MALICLRFPRFCLASSHYLTRRNTCSLTKESFTYCQLDKRGILRISGEDSVKLLQGLVTNNVELFHQDATLKTMYSMILNAQGRVLYDTVLYKDKTGSDSPSFLVECDKSAVASLTKLIKMYKLRSKVNISSAEDILPWVLFRTGESESSLPDIQSESNLIHFGKDPRTRELGWRVLLSQGATPTEVLKLEGMIEGDQGAYEMHRVQLGVSEGMDEIKPGVALPLEYNLDYINGVSFLKGCYIGQELTARTHHTGVIRKRIMPFTFNPPESIIKLEHGTAIKTSSGKTSGKLCVVYGSYGLALMRMAMISDNKQYVKDNEGHDVEVCPYIPKWWPKNEETKQN